MSKQAITRLIATALPRPLPPVPPPIPTPPPPPKPPGAPYYPPVPPPVPAPPTTVYVGVQPPQGGRVCFWAAAEGGTGGMKYVCL